MNVNAVVLLCLLLTAVAISNQVLAQADACCFALTSRRISWRILKSYQISNDECPLKAVIFTTSRNMQICANPTQKWVQNAMQHLDYKLTHSLKRGALSLRLSPSPSKRNDCRE